MDNTYECPMHSEVVSKNPGKCHICGMSLVKKETNQETGLEKYQPLIIVISLIVLPVVLAAFKDFQLGIFSFDKFMTNFMAGFFLVFSGFKLLDLKGFAEGYSTYDLLAKRVYQYGYIYPFIELGLGLGYLLEYNLPLINLLTFAVMIFSGVGVFKSLAKKNKIQCTCLGTVLKVPLSYVTLVEDLGMAAMALMLLLK